MNPWSLKPANDSGLSTRERTLSLHRESGLLQSIGHVAWWSLMRAYLATWHRMEIVGREHLPTEPPFILVANHASHLDVFMLGAYVSWRHRDRVFPLAAGDVFFEDPSRAVFAMGLLNALPIWRKRRTPEALKLLRERLVVERCAYILFPEGARSRDGGLLPFKSGVGMLVAGTDIPVVPCYLEGAFRAMPPGAKIPRPFKLRVHVAAPRRFEGAANERSGWDQVCETLKGDVEKLAAGITSGITSGQRPNSRTD
ncbi:MAG: 1-acyl-sn-glycerol-3-phosphate acyltransferase [Phycisphaerae bacterium]|nr:1-acyl-sn-glycerol-3-phosphate acyltransferase [Phycisphaerae bacterium]